MSFDAYHKWLGIPPRDQPAHHYRLLGIALFEDDPDVIETAADQRMALLRTLQTGSHSALSQKLLNEVSAAKLCLLSPSRKSDYDTELRGRESAQVEKPAGPIPAPKSQPITEIPHAAGLLPVGTARIAPASMVPVPMAPMPMAPMLLAPAAFTSPPPATVEPGVQPLVVSDASTPRRVGRARRSSMSSTAFSWLVLAVVAIPTFSVIGYLILDKQRRDAEAARSKNAMHESLRESRGGAEESRRHARAETRQANARESPRVGSLVDPQPELPPESARPPALADGKGSGIFDDWKLGGVSGAQSGSSAQQIDPDVPRRSLADLAESADNRAPVKDVADSPQVKEIKKSIEARNADIAKLTATRVEVEAEIKWLEQRLPALGNQLSKARKREDAQRTLTEISAVKHGIKTGRTRIKRIDQEIDTNRRYNETARTRLQTAAPSPQR